jgi:hypothetical protein
MMSMHSENTSRKGKQDRADNVGSDIATASTEASIDTSVSAPPTTFDLMKLPPKSRLHIYEHFQRMVWRRLPLRNVGIHYTIV